MMTWAMLVAYMGEKNYACRILVGKAEQKGPLWRIKHRWESHVKMDS
jgi:hypothetical protein